MIQRFRSFALLVATAAAVTACRKQPEVTPDPVPPPTSGGGQTTMPTTPAGPTGPSAEEIARRAADSIRRVEAARANLQAPIYFDYDQDAIRADAQTVLESKLPILRANPAVRLRISGHTDDRGSDEYNLALGQRRAASARRWLELRGIDPSRIDIVSFGEERPAATGMDEGSWQRNRRDEFEIVAGGNNLIVPGS